jgi:hypothetical protein
MSIAYGPHLNHPLCLMTDQRGLPVLATRAEDSKKNCWWGGGGGLATQNPQICLQIIYKQEAVAIGVKSSGSVETLANSKISYK